MPADSRNLPLPFGDAALPLAAAPAAGLPAGCGAQRLWLCLQLPQLPLEVVAAPGEAPQAVLAGGRQDPVILLPGATAAACGVHPGMPLNAALALLPGLGIRQRRPGLEQAALARLSSWAARFTPLVNVDPGGDALLLEIAASCALFGGPAAMLAAAVAGVAGCGHDVRAAIAPTARAALWLARAGRGQVVEEPARLPAVLAGMPVNLPGWPAATVSGLLRMGINRLGGCMRLPRDGFTRRFGRACLQEIDEALGRRPELRPACRQDGRLRDDLELPVETCDGTLLLDALQLLLLRLRARLQPRQAGVQVLWVRLHHRAARDSLLRIGLLRPSIDVAQLRELAALHLCALRLPAPVVALALEADVAELPPMAREDLLGLQLDQGERLAGLVERLRLRLGIHAVHGLRASPEPRPERAWQPVTDDRGAGVAPAAAVACGLRPLWILTEPAALARRGALPQFHGPLAFEDGPERIEAGWWDGDDVRRDYYVARSPRGLRLWVFQERRSGRWYLHGLFG